MSTSRLPGYEAVARVEDVPEGTLLGVSTADGEPICLVNHGGRITALADRCTHQEFPLSSGTVEPDGTVQCIWHGAKFDCRTGRVRQPPARDPVAVYEVRIVDGAVLVRPRR